MNIGGLIGALLPVFFVLALGYFAGKRNAFDADQAAGFSKLAVSYALPAALFVSVTEIPKDLLLQQGYSCSRFDSFSCRPFLDRLVRSGTGQIAARHTRDNLCTGVIDLRYSRFRSGGS